MRDVIKFLKNLFHIGQQRVVQHKGDTHKFVEDGMVVEIDVSAGKMSILTDRDLSMEEIKSLFHKFMDRLD